MKRTLAWLLSIALVLSLAGCGKAQPKTPGELWDSAVYTEDQEFGSGSTTVYIAMQVPEHEVTFTVHTDKETVGEVLLEHDLASGKQGQYGLYVKTVNGITADYDVDHTFWAFCKDGVMMNVGVDGAKIADGDHYELVYTK